MPSEWRRGPAGGRRKWCWICNSLHSLGKDDSFLFGGDLQPETWNPRRSVGGEECIYKGVGDAGEGLGVEVGDVGIHGEPGAVDINGAEDTLT